MCNKAFPEPGQKCCATCKFLKDCECSELMVDERGVLWLVAGAEDSTMNHLKPPPGFSCRLHKERKDAGVWRVWECLDRPGAGDLAQGDEWYHLGAHDLDEARRLCDHLNEH